MHLGVSSRVYYENAHHLISTEFLAPKDSAHGINYESFL